MKLFTRSLTATLASAALALGLAGCSSAGSAPSQETLRVGELGSAKVIETLLDLAGEDDTAYTVDYSLFAAGPALLEAVPSGSIDLGLMADTPSIFAQVNGLPLKVVQAATTNREGLSTVEIFAKPSSGITSVADLAGKKVATTESTILQYTLFKALEKAGLDYSEVTVVNLPPADALAAFNSGDVDALTALDPQLSQIAASGAVKIGDGVGTTSGMTFFSATDQALADEAVSQNIGDFLERYTRAQKWAQAHQSEWAAAYARVTGLDEKTAAAVVARQDYTVLPLDEQVIADQQAQADGFVSLGLLKEKVDVRAEFDDRFSPATTR